MKSSWKPRMPLLQIVSASVALLVMALVGATSTVAAEPARPVKTLLAVLAHPDDEMVCAGTLARAAASGWEARVIYATSGDAGEDVSGRQLKGAALGREREREGACALAALGLKGSPTFLGFGDGTLAQAQRRLTERLAKELAGLKPNVIVTFGPDGFTGHADHIAVGKVTDEVAKKGMPDAAVYHAALGKQLEGFARAADAAVPKGVKLPENLVTVDVKAFQQQRLASLDCHKTQWTAELQARLREFRRDFPFEEYVWTSGGQGAPGKWVGP